MRHGIVSKAICGEAGVVDTKMTENWKAIKLPKLIDGFSLTTSLLWMKPVCFTSKLLPNRSQDINGEACVGGKKTKKRLRFWLPAT